MIDNRNDGQHQKDVNEARCDMESEKSTQPHQQEHNSDDSKHYLPPETIFATPSGESLIGHLLALRLNTSNAVVGAEDSCRRLVYEDVCKLVFAPEGSTMWQISFCSSFQGRLVHHARFCGPALLAGALREIARGGDFSRTRLT
jgi:hypothetical protein